MTARNLKLCKTVNGVTAARPILGRASDASLVAFKFEIKL